MAFFPLKKKIIFYGGVTDIVQEQEIQQKNNSAFSQLKKKIVIFDIIINLTGRTYCKK